MRDDGERIIADLQHADRTASLFSHVFRREVLSSSVEEAGVRVKNAKRFSRVTRVDVTSVYSHAYSPPPCETKPTRQSRITIHIAGMLYRVSDN